MTKSLEDLIKRTITSNSSPVITNANKGDAESLRRRHQELLIDTLAQQHLAEQERRSARIASGVGSTSLGLSAPTMSIRSNYSEMILNGSGATSGGAIADQSYVLDYSVRVIDFTSDLGFCR